MRGDYTIIFQEASNPHFTEIRHVPMRLNSGSDDMCVRTDKSRRDLFFAVFTAREIPLEARGEN